MKCLIVVSNKWLKKTMDAKKLNVVFFGASVTEQNKSDSFWHFIRSLPDFGSNKPDEYQFDFSRLSFASSRFGNAGICNYDHLLALRPNLVVLDWLSTDEQDIDQNTVNAVFHDLTSRGIKIICTSLIRFDAWNQPAPIYFKFLSAAIKYNASFLDMRWTCDQSGLGWADVTRDGVHTNEFGAKFYSETIMNEVNGIFTGKPPTRTIHPAVGNDDLSVLAPPARPAPQPLSMSTYFIGREISVVKGQTLGIKVYVPPPGDLPISTSPQIWCKQSVGPFSPVISVRAHKEELINLPDQWCHYTRASYKPLLLTALDGAEGIVDVRIKIEDQMPDFGDAGHDNNKKTDEKTDRKIRVHDRIVGMGCSILTLGVRDH